MLTRIYDLRKRYHRYRQMLFKDPKVKEIIADVMVAIVTKDFDKLLTQIKEALPDLIKALAGCVLDTKVVEDTPKLNA